MAIPAWQPSTLYPPGSTVQPRTGAAIQSFPPDNPSFESSGTDWTATGAGWTYPTGALPFDGTRIARYTHNGADTIKRLVNTAIGPAIPGETINARAFARLGGAQTNAHLAEILVEWLDASDAVISVATSTVIGSNSNVQYYDTWRQLLIRTTPAPALAVGARIRLNAYTDTAGQTVDFDLVSWNTVDQQLPPEVVFRAVQTNTGLSGSVEPNWPETDYGPTVFDNEVEWEAIAFVPDAVVWQANPILESGATEPTWPTAPGASVLDGTIAWEAVTRRIDDARCPNTKVVAIAASKIFAGDNDIIAFSATVNPLDWSTPEDAGYIPFGLQTYGATPLSGLGLYRSNLVAFNSQSFQMWQVDEDPQNHAILDAVPVGCNFHKSIHPVSNDLVFLTEQGIRNIGIAGASTNIQAGFFGKQIDPLVQAKLIEARDEGYEPFGLFWPAAGQYWLFFQEEAFILTMNGGKEDMHWSRYIFPEPVEDWALVDDKLVLRAGDKLWEMDDELLEDDVEYEGGTEIPGYVAWPYLDFGQIGREKQLYGFDLVFEGQAGVSFGYSQTNFTLATDPYVIVPEDTLPGQPIPMPLAGPSFQIRLEMESLDAPWEVQAVAIYLQDMRGGT